MVSINRRLELMEQRLAPAYVPPTSDFDYAEYQRLWDRHTAAGLGFAVQHSMNLLFGRLAAVGWDEDRVEAATAHEVALERLMAEALAHYDADPAGYEPPAWTRDYSVWGDCGCDDKDTEYAELG